MPAYIFILAAALVLLVMAFSARRGSLRIHGKIDAIVPCYNEEVCLVPALMALLANSYFNRVIAVNDGSTDRTAEILDDMATRHERLTVVHQANTGKGGSIAYRATWVDPEGGSSFVAHLVNLTVNDGHGGGKTQLWLGAGASSLERTTLDGDFTGRDYSATLRRHQPIGGNLDLVQTGGVTSYARPYGRV